MNHKHIALVLLAIVAFGLIQIVLMFQKKRDTTALQAETLRNEEINQRQLLAVQTTQLNDTQRSAQKLIDFLDEWEKPLAEITSPESAEVRFITKIRDGNLASLAQRFETIQLKAGSSLPTATRAQLTFEDNYARLLNWVGGLEEALPAVRVNSIKISKGTRPQDVRMEITLDQPIYTQ